MKYKVNREDFDEIEIGELFVTEEDGEILRFENVINTNYEKDVSTIDDLVYVFSDGYLNLETNEFVQKYHSKKYYICYSSDLRGSEDGVAVPTIVGRYLTLKDRLELI